MENAFEEHHDGNWQFYWSVVVATFSVLVLLVSVPLCGQQQLGGKRTMTPVTDRPDHDAQLYVVEITPRYDGKSYRGRFKLRTRSQEIDVYGSKTSAKGKILASQVRGEIFEAGAWRSVRMFSDAIPLTVTVAPGQDIEVLADLPFVEESTGRHTVRISWSGMVSDTFVLDWQSDRKAGKFALARIQHIDNLRQLLIKAGFKEEALTQDDFWSDFVRRLQRGVSASEGFAVFQTKVVSLPEIVDGNCIEYHLWSDDISDHENCYQLTMFLNPSVLPVGWLQTPRFTARTVDVGQLATDAGRKRIVITIGDLTSMPQADLGFQLELVYVPVAHDEPGEKALRDLTNVLLDELRSYFSK